MSSATEATAATATPKTAYEGAGGAGGKFRKRPVRRNQTTPYDRPPTALRNPSWLTKLVVDPASKLIYSGAQRFFSSLFSKRLPPPPPTPLPPTPPPGLSFGASSSAPLTNAGSIVNHSPFNFSATSASSQVSSAAGTVGSSWQPPKSTGFTSSFSSSTPSGGFTFGASSSSFASPSTSPVVFGSTPSAASGSTSLFGSTSSTNSPSQPMFGNSTFAASPGNNDNMEDSMAEDLVQAPAPAVSFGQHSVSPSPGGFAFGSAQSTFQFGGQQSRAAPQNSSPFAASSSLVQAAPQISPPFAASNSLEFGGGSFLLGSSGPGKSGRKIVKVNRSKHRRR